MLTGAGVACLLTSGFAGVASMFDEADAPWAMGYVVGAQSLAWIVGNPIVGLLADTVSWRLSYAVPATIAALALAAGLAAPRAQRSVAAPGRAGIDLAEPEARCCAIPSARRWTIAELVAYSAWTAELTYAGAFYIEAYGVSEATVGVLLAVGSLVFLVGSLSTARLTRLVPRPDARGGQLAGHGCDADPRPELRARGMGHARDLLRAGCIRRRCAAPGPAPWASASYRTAPGA